MSVSPQALAEVYANTVGVMELSVPVFRLRQVGKTAVIPVRLVVIAWLLYRSTTAKVPVWEVKSMIKSSSYWIFHSSASHEAKGSGESPNCVSAVGSSITISPPPLSTNAFRRVTSSSLKGFCGPAIIITLASSGIVFVASKLSSLMV